MDYKKFISGFSNIFGIISCAIIENLSPPKIYLSDGCSEEFRNCIENLTQIMTKNVLDTSIADFQFKSSSKRLLCYSEQDIFLILLIDNDFNKNILMSKVHEFLNKVLLES
ncbi:MAG: hypothetical protein P8Y70_14325 [Candidatus Lokiarchaeota archaeon]